MFPPTYLRRPTHHGTGTEVGTGHSDRVKTTSHTVVQDVAEPRRSLII